MIVTLKDNVALVTGSAGATGSAVGSAFAADGADMGAGADWVQSHFATRLSPLRGPAAELTADFSAFCAEAGRRTRVDDKECLLKR